jgi:hypothetical protein
MNYNKRDGEFENLGISIETLVRGRQKDERGSQSRWLS